MVEAEKSFLQDGAGRFSHAEKLGKIFGELRAVAGFGIEADQFAERGLVEGVENTGAVEDSAGSSRAGYMTKLFREEERVGGAELRVAEEGIEHELGAGGVLQAEEGDGAEAVEVGGKVGVFLVFLAHGVFRLAQGGGVIAGGEVGLDAGEAEGVGGIVAGRGERAEAFGEIGLGGVDSEPREKDEGFGLAGKIGEIGGEFALGGGAVVGGVIVEEKIDAGAGAGGVVELAEEGVAAGLGGVAELAVVANEVEVEFVAFGEAGDLALEADQGEIGVAALPIALGEEDRALERFAEAPGGDELFGGVVAAAFEVRGGGLEGDVEVGERGVGRGREKFFRELDEAIVFAGLEEKGEEEFEVVEIGGGEFGAVGESLEGEVGAAEADLGISEEATAGDIGGDTGEPGLEERVAFAVALVFEGDAAEAKVVLAEAGAVVLGAEGIEGEVEVIDVGVAALEADEGPDAAGGDEPRDDDKGGEEESDPAPENVMPDVIRGDDSDPEFEPVVGIE